MVLLGTSAFKQLLRTLLTTSKEHILQDFRNLEVWKKSHELTLSVYESTSQFPREEIYGLTSQMRRAVRRYLQILLKAVVERVLPTLLVFFK